MKGGATLQEDLRALDGEQFLKKYHPEIHANVTSRAILGPGVRFKTEALKLGSPTTNGNGGHP